MPTLLKETLQKLRCIGQHIGQNKAMQSLVPIK